MTVLFCGTCSSTLFVLELCKSGPDRLWVPTGVLNSDKSVEKLLHFGSQVFVGDTVDGGASPWLRHVNGDGGVSRQWMGAHGTSEELQSTWPPVETLRKSDDKSGPDEIPIWCHCKGVNLVLRRGDAAFAAMDNTDSWPFFIDPTTHKHIASFDACNSCRTTFGGEIVNWTFILLTQLHFANDSGTNDTALPTATQDLKNAVLDPNRDSRYGTLSMYASSPDVQRYFCSRCSSAVLYAVDDRPELVDLAIGLLDAPEGARAESLLLWNLGSKIGGKDDVSGGWREPIVDAVEKGAEAWRIERGYPKTWRRLAMEKSK